jgi:hypothetical protein
MPARCAWNLRGGIFGLFLVGVRMGKNDKYAMNLVVPEAGLEPARYR